jgi:hypothetical protein
MGNTRNKKMEQIGGQIFKIASGNCSPRIRGMYSPKTNEKRMKTMHRRAIQKTLKSDWAAVARCCWGNEWNRGVDRRNTVAAMA